MQNRFQRATLGLLVFCCFTLSLNSASANDKALAIFDRVSKFITTDLGGGGTQVLVVDTGGGSAQGVVDFFTKNPKVANQTVTVSSVTPDALAGAVSGSTLMIVVPAGSAAAFDAVKAAAGGSKVLAFGLDKACVDAAACTLSIETDPKTQIYISRSGRSAHDIEFKQAFLVMAIEV